MPLPNRFSPQTSNKQIVTKLKTLLKNIEDEINSNHCDEHESGVLELIAQWNVIAVREFEFHEFRDYHSWIDQDQFILSALYQAKYFNDLRFDEVVSIVEFICSAEGDEAIQNYALELLEINFPNGNASDLIYWPNEWFENEDISDDLSAEEMVNYLCLRSGRILSDTPVIALRFALPK